MIRKFQFAMAAVSLALIFPVAAAQPDSSTPLSNELTPAIRTIFIAGDSTAANGASGAIGWGKYLGTFFDSKKMNIENRARGGRSSRTFITEGLWDSLLQKVHPGDIVLIQFGHNDGGALDDAARARGSIPGTGEETKEIDNPISKKHETVHTFGWYIRKMIADTKAKQAYPIVFSLTVRNEWKEGHVERGSGRFGGWSREVAKTEKVPFVDLTKIIADRYEKIGQEAVKPLFPRDHTHTSEDGAKLNAELVVAGLKGLRDQTIIGSLNVAGRVISNATPDNVIVGPRIGPRMSTDPAGFQRWLNLPLAADPTLPSLYLIGDSTVRTGRGDGDNGQFGWGDPIENYFDRTRINVVNRAVGGTGAGTYRTQKHWEPILADLKPGDVVLMQFGHNDNGVKGAIKGVGDETEERENATSKKTELIHTFGWYMRQYITEIRSKGATPIVCSLIPRNNWKDGKIARSRNSHADWAKTVAESEHADFIDLHELIAVRYDALGPDVVMPLFADQRVHTSWLGAVLNAECVNQGLKALPLNPLSQYYLVAAISRLDE